MSTYILDSISDERYKQFLFVFIVDITITKIYLLVHASVKLIEPAIAASCSTVKTPAMIATLAITARKLRFSCIAITNSDRIYSFFKHNYSTFELLFTFVKTVCIIY